MNRLSSIISQTIFMLFFMLSSFSAFAQQTEGFENPLKGKIINVLGDSYVRNHRCPYTEAWHSLVAERNGMIYRNYGRNGSSIVYNRENEGFGPEMLVRYSEMNDTADYVLIIAGHNDACIIGNDSEKLDFFRKGLHKFCQLLVEKYPNSAIGFVTPWDVDKEGFEQVNQSIRQICAEYSIPVLNAAEVGGIDVRNPEFRRQFFQGPEDTAHLNSLGHELFYSTGLRFILGLKPTNDLNE